MNAGTRALLGYLQKIFPDGDCDFTPEELELEIWGNIEDDWLEGISEATNFPGTWLRGLLKEIDYEAALDELQRLKG